MLALRHEILTNITDVADHKVAKFLKNYKRSHAMSDTIDFLIRLMSLKSLKRTGRTIVGIPEAETVASHSFGTAVIAMILADLAKDVDKEKVIRLALLHDIHEYITGDIVSPAIKEGIVSIDELKAYEKALEGLPREIKENYLELLKELLEGKTKEAKLVRLADKLDQAIQAFVYYRLHPVERLKKFAEVLDELEGFDELRERIKDLFKSE